MSNEKKPVLGFYREAVDIRHLNQGKIQIAPETVVVLPRSGMYKMSTSVLLVSADEEVIPTFTPEEVAALEQGTNVVDLKTGKAWGPPSKDDDDDAKEPT